MRKAVCERASSGAEQPCPRVLSSWRLRPAAALLAAAGIAVLSALLPAAAQGATLVSNVGQARTNALGFDAFYMVQEFTTGANGSAGFTLSSVELRLSTDANAATSNAAPVVKIYSGSARGTLVATLVVPAGALPRHTTDNYTYAVPSGTTVTLEDSKSYWVVADQSATSQHVKWEAAAGDEDATGLSDWVINNNGGWTAGGTGTFMNYGQGAFQIRVNGEINTTNAAPTASPSTVDVTEDMAYTFAASDFSFSDTDTGDTLSSVKVETLPALGSLTLSGAAVSANATVTKAHLDNGDLKYTPAADGYGTAYASFMFKVNDGTADSAIRLPHDHRTS